MSADFFRRLIAVQSLGPNVVTDDHAEGDYIAVYECNGCLSEHDAEDEARDCCAPRELFKCVFCRERHSAEDSAAECCASIPMAGQPVQCMVCMKRAESFEDAAECCLPNHPTMTAWGRQRVAQAVAAGTPWPEAVQANTNH